MLWPFGTASVDLCSARVKARDNGDYQDGQRRGHFTDTSSRLEDRARQAVNVLQASGAASARRCVSTGELTRALARQWHYKGRKGDLAWLVVGGDASLRLATGTAAQGVPGACIEGIGAIAVEMGCGTGEGAFSRGESGAVPHDEPTGRFAPRPNR